MQVPFIDLHWQHEKISDTLMPRLQNIFDNSSYVGGKDVSLFEENFSRFIGVNKTVAVSNGTDALILALKSFNLKDGDEVITTPNTFFATASAIVHSGGKPVFVDIDLEARNFNFDLLEKSITEKTKVIIPVHLYGQAVDMDRLMAIAKKHNIAIVEDACQAHGAKYKGKVVGSFGDVACFSFYPGKNLGAYGDAGAVVLNDENRYITIKKLRDHGSPKKYEHDLIGYNSRMDTIQAAVLDTKLSFINEWNGLRRIAAGWYDDGLSSVESVAVYKNPAYSESVYHLYIISVPADKRDDLLSFLSEKKIGAGIHYPTPLHLLPAFSYLGYSEGDLPVSEKYAKGIVSLPMFPGITKEQVEFVVEAIKEYFHESNK